MRSIEAIKNKINDSSEPKKYVPNKIRKQIYEDRIAENSYRFKIQNNLDNSTQKEVDYLNNLLFPIKNEPKSNQNQNQNQN